MGGTSGSYQRMAIERVVGGGSRLPALVRPSTTQVPLNQGRGSFLGEVKKRKTDYGKMKLFVARSRYQGS